MNELVKQIKAAGYLVSENPVPNGHYLVIYLQDRNVTAQEILRVVGPVETIFQGGHGSVVVFYESDWAKNDKTNDH